MIWFLFGFIVVIVFFCVYLYFEIETIEHEILMLKVDIHVLGGNAKPGDIISLGENGGRCDKD